MKESSIWIVGKSNALIECIEYLLGIFPKERIHVIPAKSDKMEDDWQLSVHKYCRNNQLSIHSLEEAYEQENMVFVSIQYDIILRPSKFKSNQLYNIHFSLLPDYKGVYPAIWPILNNEKKAGVTLHLIDAGIDTGDIIDQLEVPIQLSDTARDVYMKCQQAAIEIFKQNINRLIEGNISPQVQSPYQSRYYSKDSIDFSKQEINFNATALQVHNYIRAFTFREYQMPQIGETKIYRSEILNQKRIGKPGTIMEETDSYLIFSTVDYAIKLYKDYYDEFFDCCLKNQPNRLKEILTFIEDINLTDKNGKTGLAIATENNNIDIIQILTNR